MFHLWWRDTKCAGTFSVSLFSTSLRTSQTQNLFRTRVKSPHFSLYIHMFPCLLHLLLLFLHHHLFCPLHSKEHLSLAFLLARCFDRVSYVDHYRALMALYQMKPSSVLYQCHQEPILKLMVQLQYWDFSRPTD